MYAYVRRCTAKPLSLIDQVGIVDRRQANLVPSDRIRRNSARAAETPPGTTNAAFPRSMTPTSPLSMSPHRRRRSAGTVSRPRPEILQFFAALIATLSATPDLRPQSALVSPPRCAHNTRSRHFQPIPQKSGRGPAYGPLRRFAPAPTSCTHLHQGCRPPNRPRPGTPQAAARPRTGRGTTRSGAYQGAPPLNKSAGQRPSRRKTPAVDNPPISVRDAEAGGSNPPSPTSQVRG